MDMVTLSPQFEIIIPKQIRDALKLVPGERLQIVCNGDRMEFTPVRSIKSLRGLLRGMDVTLVREEDRV